MKISYKDAGVDVDRGQEAVKEMKAYVEATQGPEVLTELGTFAGLYQLPGGMEEPVLVSGTDGVGTKILMAKKLGYTENIGQDLVAMCVNDILCHGARPLFFLDYLASARLEPKEVAEVVRSIAKACGQVGCALIGGETAEMPGMYQPGDMDMAGFCVGVQDKKKLITGKDIEEGDLIVGLASSGFHSNGYSLLRKIYLEHYPQYLERFAKELCEPTTLYVKPVLKLIEEVNVLGISHITGGGFHENIPRVLPKGLGFEVDTRSWPRSELIELTAELTGLEIDELYNTFNMGIGMVVIVKEKDLDRTIEVLKSQGLDSWKIGRVIGEDKGIIK
ncbi:MAG: phosphoribosylformylglycinamidine cyclo-ligase [Tissierellia bacterium]|nr:phosphoribosylformylglycinamidine cyclo-ligase [Tissierellia bacterium]